MDPLNGDGPPKQTGLVTYTKNQLHGPWGRSVEYSDIATKHNADSRPAFIGMS